MFSYVMFNSYISYVMFNSFICSMSYAMHEIYVPYEPLFTNLVKDFYNINIF